MNLEGFPEPVKKDIEDQSLDLLSLVNKNIIVIGGWGVRALLGEKHGRYTLDVDGVTDKYYIPQVEKILSDNGLKSRDNEWGIQCYIPYQPLVEIPNNIKNLIKEIELRIEISGPKIKEHDTHHFFEFSLIEFEQRIIPYHPEFRT